jgi:hypothetical protein
MAEATVTAVTEAVETAVAEAAITDVAIAAGVGERPIKLQR